MAISALLLCASTLGLAATVARAPAGAPRMDMELGDMDAASPSRALGSHGRFFSIEMFVSLYERSKRHDGTLVKLSIVYVCAAALQFGKRTLRSVVGVLQS